MQDIELSAEERRAINSLKRLAKNWPKSLWIFAGGSGGDNVTVLRTNEDGERVHHPGDGSIDQSWAVGSVKIPSDGGDW